MSTAVENRRSFRVSERVYLKYEILTDEEFRAGIAHRNLQKGNADGAMSRLVDIDARLSEAMFLLQSESSAVARCVTLLNDKLNLVIDQSPAFRASTANLASTEPQTCDVAADGLVFASERPLSVGDCLYLQFILTTDNRYIETFCKVIRLMDPPDNSNSSRPYGIAIEFVDMPPAQREILIQHMFGRESETLRMRRLELDATGSVE